MADMQAKRQEILSRRSPSRGSEGTKGNKLNMTSRSALMQTRSLSPGRKLNEDIKPQVQVSMQSGELLCDLMKLQNILNFELLKKLG